MNEVLKAAKELTLSVGREVRNVRRGLTPGGHKSTCWPMLSTTFGACGAKDIKEKQALLEANGCKTEYTKDGKAILTSAAHRKKVGETLGYFDRNAGHGDPQPQEMHKRLLASRKAYNLAQHKQAVRRFISHTFGVSPT